METNFLAAYLLINLARRRRDKRYRAWRDDEFLCGVPANLPSGKARVGARSIPNDRPSAETGPRPSVEPLDVQLFSRQGGAAPEKDTQLCRTAGINGDRRNGWSAESHPGAGAKVAMGGDEGRRDRVWRAERSRSRSPNDTAATDARPDHEDASCYRSTLELYPKTPLKSPATDLSSLPAPPFRRHDARCFLASPDTSRVRSACHPSAVFSTFHLFPCSMR
jgi:hypothetical protein